MEKLRRRARWALGACAAVAACLALPGVASAKVENVRLLDQCDPVTFNAQFGENFCRRTGSGVRLEDFLEDLNPKKFGHRAWWINASGGRNGTTQIRSGDVLRVVNEGGIAHSFTELPAFGPGCIPDFSAPLGIGVRPFSECLPLFGTIVAQGTSTDVANLSVGTHRFQCIFHPWMRQSVEVRPT